ncbi:hypothetical protein Sta7437_4399 [Stanieria cyanosphaera PCC 7437]|uniref:Uncharacterized protein n=1 Tax=Stanieria cyanosphaera (strain ATCC 29371 / PCC 7437) TaxID=111780 RepID=K9XZB6_STAC7|nr:hypothetical protein [Stanieria cyanosphaera]AFZ37868.1 hypothetical protein Sta7437_4399 [Stanieria cyanosphaera PCC 7437]
MRKLFTLALIVFSLFLTIIIDFNFQPINIALAGQVDSETAQKTREAADKVVQDDQGVKEQFGKSESGEELIDKARNEAQKKLDSLANKADSNQSLPDHEQVFLKNVEGKNK